MSGGRFGVQIKVLNRPALRCAVATLAVDRGGFGLYQLSRRHATRTPAPVDMTVNKTMAPVTRSAVVFAADTARPPRTDRFSISSSVFSAFSAKSTMGQRPPRQLLDPFW